MNRLKIFVVIGMITAFCANFAWAASVDVVEVDEGRNAVVDVTICGEGATIDDSKVVSDDDTLYIFFAATELRVKECVTTEESIPVPSCSEYSKIVALLYSDITTVPDDITHTYLTVDSLGVELDVDIEGCCREEADKCLDDKEACLAVEEECMDACDPNGDFREYLACMSDCDCEEKYNCRADYEMCMMPVEEEVITADCDPDTLNLKSNGNYVTCYLSSTYENGVEDIDQTSLWLHLADTTSSLPALFSAIEEDMLMVKFSRPALIAAIAETALPLPRDVELMVSGDQDAGDSFEAMDTITAINPPKFKTSLFGQTVMLTGEDFGPLAVSATIFWGDRGSDTVPVAELLSPGVAHTYYYKSKHGYKIRVQVVDSNGVKANYTSTKDDNLEVVVQ